jgi:6-carboxyhexanoate--CoA ligase
VKRYVERALSHPKGSPDAIVITVENIKQKPMVITALPIMTVRCRRPSEAREIATKLLCSLGISEKAADIAFDLARKGGIRGAAVLTGKKGIRIEPDRERGVRVSRLGINKAASRSLSIKLARYGINTDTVKEAIILSSKVISCKHGIAELCVSDDPDYTTGYVASKKYGYVRIPHIKPKGASRGGRVFFVNEGIKIEDVIEYLEKIPVIIGKASSCRGVKSIDEILDNPHQ